MFIKLKILALRAALPALVLAILSSVAFVDVNNIYHQANVLSIPDHDPFDGTVYPIKDVPNWTKLDSSKRDAHYSELRSSDLIPIPYYDPSVLAFDASDLVWGRTDHDDIRNAKITYSVPYMGNYKLDGIEYAGSHPAVDIKVPIGTPVYAMANGTVTKASTQSDGFGHHVVITHKNFPTLKDSNVTETIHSSYSHLSAVFVSQGDVVRKGEKVGLVGDTGTATTPHLHFQVDRATAPWSPFWPFTWKEVHEAGLNFFSAVNEGLGKERALEVTINPMKYVQKYLDHDGSYSPPSAGPPADSYVSDDTPSEEEAKTGPESTSYVREDYIEPEVIMSDPLPQEEGVFRFSDVSSNNEYHEAILFLAEEGIIQGYEDGTFRPDELVNRVEALKFILESIQAELLPVGTAPFNDILHNAWYAKYLYTGYGMGIVDGHPDGSFKPSDPVNKAELLKILFNGMKVDIPPHVEHDPYVDVPHDAWFAPYVAYAKTIGVLDPMLRRAEPDKSMTRGEVADAMFKLIQLTEG